MNTDGELKMKDDTARMNELTEKIIGSAFLVANTLGSGFLEKVYENALSHEVTKAGLRVEQQKSMQVMYDGVVVGDYVADMVVEDRVLMEIKAVRALDKVHFAQCLNYLKATGLRIGLLVNFGSPRIQVRRILND
jgi:GxxExxY protein